MVAPLQFRVLPLSQYPGYSAEQRSKGTRKIHSKSAQDCCRIFFVADMASELCHFGECCYQLIYLVLQLDKIEKEGFTLNLYYADETGLWWRLLPSKSFVHW